jgi:hypothetical protein
MTTTITHTPTKCSYQSPKENCDTVLPIIQDKWNVECSSFMDMNTCTGLIISCKVFESALRKRKSRHLYSVKIVNTPKPKFWTAANRTAIKSVSLDLLLFNAKKAFSFHMNLEFLDT